MARFCKYCENVADENDDCICTLQQKRDEYDEQMEAEY